MLSCACPAAAETNDDGLIVSLVGGPMRGNTTYHISVYSGAEGVESELEFPLRAVMAGVELSYKPHNTEGLRLTGRYLTNMTDGSGKMKDSDWLTNYYDILKVGSPHPGLDIYSESDIDLQAYMLDLKAAIDLHEENKFTFGVLGGLRLQRFQFEAFNTNQMGFGPYAPVFTGFIPGKTIDYRVMYVILYGGVTAGLRIHDALRADASLAFSPLTFAKDQDDHVLRDKLSKAETYGYAALAEFGLTWTIESTVEMRASGEYIAIRTKGDQTQTWYGPADGVPVGTTYTGIDDKITSDQFTALLTLTFRI
jgi:outer membrane protease